MSNKWRWVAVLSTALMLIPTVPATAKNGSKDRKSDAETKESKEQGTPVLWRNPEDIKSRNLFYGPGGEEHAPHTTYTFEKEDMNGTSPKFIVRDENGVRWKVKMGAEARPETVASRFVWAVGYSTNEDYFLPELHVEGYARAPSPGAEIRRTQRHSAQCPAKKVFGGEKKVGIWKWGDNPFSSTRELNGLRVMMALINNWDLKDDNNSIYHEKHPEGFRRPRKYLHGERPRGKLRNHGSYAGRGRLPKEISISTAVPSLC